MTENVVSDLKGFLRDLQDAIGVRLPADGPQNEAHRRVFAGLSASQPKIGAMQPARQPACAHLQACYEQLEAAGPALRRLAASFRAIEPRLGWSNRSERHRSAALADRYADAVITGPDGLLPSEAARIGISVMAPETVYLDHRHPPEELYIALSAGSWRQEDGPWHEPGIGGLVYNPANIVHAMRSGESPFLAIWCLPLS